MIYYTSFGFSTVISLGYIALKMSSVDTLPTLDASSLRESPVEDVSEVEEKAVNIEVRIIIFKFESRSLF